MENKNAKIVIKLKEFIDANYNAVNYSLLSNSMMMRDGPPKVKEFKKSGFLVDEPFNVKLFKLIDASGKSDVDVYKKAGLDRRHFSKIKSSSAYIPQKKTIIAFIIALELSLEKAEPLLDCAGYSLSPSYLFDVIVKFFISEGIYDVTLLNECLLEYDQPLINY